MFCKLLWFVPFLVLLKIIDDCSREDDGIPDPVYDQRLMVFSFDGFRYDYMSPQLTPNLHRLAFEDGVTGHMLSTFATKTFPNHHSIATGLYQETHGIVNNVMWDSRIGELFIHKKAELLSNAWWDNGESTPLYIANQLYEEGRASCCAPWIGCHARYYKIHQAKHLRQYNQSADWTEQFEWALEKMTRTKDPANLVMMYIPYPDLTSHPKGPFGQETIEEVQKLDKLVGHIRLRLAETRLDRSTNLIILSDHGMTEISSARTLVLESFMNTSWFDSYGSNPVVHIQPKPGYEQIVQKTLMSKEVEGHFTMYLKHNLPARFHYRFHRRVMAIILVADEGWSIYGTLEEAQLKRTHTGQHGYDNQLHSMRPLFAAVGPAFNRAYIHPAQFINVDLYPLMLTLLGIPHNRFYHEGDLKKVRELLK